MRTALSWLTAAAVAAGAWAGPCHPVDAGEVTASVRDQGGRPVAEAVVSAFPEGRATPAEPVREVVDQINLEFVPYVKPIVVGSPVYFPNKDNVRHHVYSFSPAKRFELPLYVGTPADPVVFDRPGIVTIGCNIHDWMIGYIYVAETPHMAKTAADGRARLDHLPAGRYDLRVWHPRMEQPEESTRRALSLEQAGGVSVTWQVTLKPSVRPRRAPVPGTRGYR
jgi:plastocyanin